MQTPKIKHRKLGSLSGPIRLAVRPTLLLTALLTALLAALLAPSCSSTLKSDSAAPDSVGTDSPRGSGSVLTGKILVSAASSLTLPFTQITEGFLKAHPGAEVTLNFGSSGQLATQIKQGAPADLAAFADAAPMKELAGAGLVVEPVHVFARNQLALVSAATAQNQIVSLSDLAGRVTLGNLGTVSLCEETAPCGKYARQALAAAGVRIPERNITRGSDARATLRAVTEGDADVAIVYVTDALLATADPRTATRIESVAIPEEFNITSTYVMAEITQDSSGTAASNNPVAQAFMQYVLSRSGQKLLSEAGFLSP